MAGELEFMAVAGELEFTAVAGELEFMERNEVVEYV